MRYAQIDNGTVVNILEAEGDFAEEYGLVPLEAKAGIGWSYADGAFTAPAPTPPPVPETVSPMRAKLALLQYGYLEAAEAIIAQAQPAIRIMWDNALEFRRDDPAVNAVGVALGMSSQQMDALFRAAASAKSL